MIPPKIPISITMIIQHIRRSVNIRKRCNMHKSAQIRPAHILRFTVLLSVRFRVGLSTQNCTKII